jgi:hypothetical protein
MPQKSIFIDVIVLRSCWGVAESEYQFSFAQQIKASGMIKFLAGSCLSELGIVLKELL